MIVITNALKMFYNIIWYFSLNISKSSDLLLKKSKPRFTTQNHVEGYSAFFGQSVDNISCETKSGPSKLFSKLSF